MAHILVIHAAQDKQFAEAFIRAAHNYEPNLTFDARDNVETFALDTATLAQYANIIALLSPEALNSPPIAHLLEACAALSDSPLLPLIVRPVTLPPFLSAFQTINVVNLSPQQLADLIFAPVAASPAEKSTEAYEAPMEEEESAGEAELRDEWPYLEEERGLPTAPPAPAPYQSPPPPPEPAPAPRPSPHLDQVGGAASDQPKTPGRYRLVETLQFSAYHPNEAPVETWQTCLVYTHLPAHISQVQADAGTFTELGSAPTMAQGQSLRKIPRNVEITVEPHMEGVTFSPAQDSFLWRGEWHRSLFRYSGAKALAGREQRGWIDIYAERISPICTLEVTFSFHPGIPTTVLSVPRGVAVTSNAFDTVFISYSHRDREPMHQALETYRKLNITVYNDNQLAAGENYEQRLSGMIRAANVFHLLWSDASAQSAEVRKEWALALACQKGERFIRPWYWQRRFIPPPDELQVRRISFRYEHLRRRLLRPSTWL